MRHPGVIIAGLGLAAVAVVSTVAGASAGGSAAGSAPAGSRTAAAATVRSAPAGVAGNTETSPVNAQGLPLYFNLPGTAGKSFVTAGLARSWPPLTSAAPNAVGVKGKLTVLNDTSGYQIAYNAHQLNTFISDHAGQVTGQGFQDFSVATPGLAPIAGSPAGTVPAVPADGRLAY